LGSNPSGEDGAREVLRPRAMFFLNQANHAVRSRLETALGSVEMTGIQYTVLSVIGRHQGMSSAELSRRFYVTPQTMNELIGALERRGLILRKADPSNRRILRMNVTPSGRELLDRCDALADGVERDIFGNLSEADYRQLAELTRKLAHALRNPDDPA
jgi:DNA-binding MarR family transcriptional regulator